MQTKCSMSIRLMGIMLLVSTLCASNVSASSTSTTVTVGPGSDLGLGYGTFEGAKVLTLNIQPKSRWRIISSECIDNTGNNIWYQYSTSSTLHKWKTFGVLPNFSTSESHAAVIRGYLAPIGPGDSSSGSPAKFWARVNDIDADVDSLGKHTDSTWSPLSPTHALAELEDRCEDGTSGGLGIPVTDPGASLPSTLSAGSGKALRVRINAKKSGGKLRFSGQGTKLAVYKATSDAATQTKVTGDISYVPGMRYYIHTCTGFTAVNLVTEYISTQTSDVAKDTVRVYPEINDYQLYVNTPSTADDYVPVESCGRVPITVTRNTSDTAVELKLKDNNASNCVKFYNASTGGTGVADKIFTMPAGTSSKTFWVSGDVAGKGVRIINLLEKNGENWDEKKTLYIYVFDMILKELSFAGTGQHVLKKTGSEKYDYNTQTFANDGDTTIVNPVWKDDNGDRDTDDANDKNDPVCYTRGNNPSITAKFEFTPTLPLAVEFRIVGDRKSPGYGATTEQIFNSNGGQFTKTFQVASFNGSILKKYVCWVGLCFTWKLSIEDDISQCTFGESNTHIFATYGTPWGSSVTAKRMHWATWSAGNRNLGNSAKPGSGLTSTDIPRNLQLAVYNDSEFQGGAGHPNEWEIMDPAKVGCCMDFARLMKSALNIIGVPVGMCSYDSVTSHSVVVKTWLGNPVNYNILRWFKEEGTSFWVNEGVCGVDVTDKPTRVWYDVAHWRHRYGPRLGPNAGALITAATKSIPLVENMWREPNGGNGPVMWEWGWWYSDGIASPLPHQVKVTQPNGGENITIGDNVTVKFLTAGLQGRTVKIYYSKSGVNTLIGSVTIATMANEADNFSKESTIVWNTTGLAAGQYIVKACLDDITQSYSHWKDESDGTCTFGN